jgi:cation transport regulator ChaC
MSAHVFAFGSNMCSGRFRDYLVAPEGKGEAALLHGYRLCFNKKSKKDESGKANVEPHLSGKVWGVLYSIPDRDLEKLDHGEVGYIRQRVVVENHAGARKEAWMYVAKPASTEQMLRPYSWYKRFLVEGAREHGLPTDYADTLERIDAIEDADKERDARKRSLQCK